MTKDLAIGRTIKMILYKQVLIDSKATNAYFYDSDLLMLIRDQINQSEKNLGQFDFPDTTNAIDLAKAAFLYRNAVVEKGILYVDIETIHTPDGIVFRRLVESGTRIIYKPAGTGRHEYITDQMGIQKKTIDIETYRFLTACALISEQN